MGGAINKFFNGIDVKLYKTILGQCREWNLLYLVSGTAKEEKMKSKCMSVSVIPIKWILSKWFHFIFNQLRYQKSIFQLFGQWSFYASLKIICLQQFLAKLLMCNIILSCFVSLLVEVFFTKEVYGKGRLFFNNSGFLKMSLLPNINLESAFNLLTKVKI